MKGLDPAYDKRPGYRPNSVPRDDRWGERYFHLTGPGLNKSTSVSAKGTSTWKVTLKPGTYKYVCDPHASFMKGSFKVT